MKYQYNKDSKFIQIDPSKNWGDIISYHVIKYFSKSDKIKPEHVFWFDPKAKQVFKNGKIGEFYNIGSNKNLNNLEITKTLLQIAKNKIKIGSKVKVIFVKDRLGHDLRYAINSNKIKNMLGWKPKIKFYDGLKLTSGIYHSCDQWIVLKN